VIEDLIEDISWFIRDRFVVDYDVSFDSRFLEKPSPDIESEILFGVRNNHYCELPTSLRRVTLY